jgi:hypothetical protein
LGDIERARVATTELLALRPDAMVAVATMTAKVVTRMPSARAVSLKLNDRNIGIQTRNVLRVAARAVRVCGGQIERGVAANETRPQASGLKRRQSPPAQGCHAFCVPVASM